MKVKVIDNFYENLTEGKDYDVINESDNAYYLKIDKKESKRWFNKRHFEVCDYINHPTHYNKGIETIKYISSWEMDFLEGNIIKYVTRYKDKNGVEDLKKANQYLEWLIEREEKK